MRGIESGKVLDFTFSAGHKIETVRIENREYQYLYQEGSEYVFMNNETYDQVSIKEEMLERPNLLKEGTGIEILFHAEKDIPLTADLPAHIVLEVSYAEQGVRGDIATPEMTRTMEIVLE